MTKFKLMLMKAARNSRLGQLRNKGGPKLTLTERRQRLMELPCDSDKHIRETEAIVRRRLYGKAKDN